MRATDIVRAMRSSAGSFRADFLGTDAVVSGYARVLTQHWKLLSSQVAGFVAGEIAGNTQGYDSFGARGELGGSGRIFERILGTPVVTRARRALQGDGARGNSLDPGFPRSQNYRDSHVCEEGELSIVAAVRAAQVNATTFLTTLDLGLRTPWDAAATGVEL